jgi:hypothetical protein
LKLTNVQRRGEYKTAGFSYEYYIFLPETAKERRAFLEDIVKNATGTYIGNLNTGAPTLYIEILYLIMVVQALEGIVNGISSAIHH